MSRHRLQSIATAAVVAAVGLSAVAGAADAKPAGAGGSGVHKSGAKKLKRGGGGFTLPPKSTTTAVALEAFPAGGKGSGTEEECANWTTWLREADAALNDAVTTVEIINASDNLKAEKDAALDAGCAVID